MKLRKIYIRNKQMTVNRYGFTLIEILIVVFIFAIIGGLVAFVGIDQYRRYSLFAERDVLVGMLQKARNQSMNNINEAPHGVRILSASYVGFLGSSYASRNTAYDEVMPKSLAVTTAGVQEFVFKQLRGDLLIGIGDATISNGIKTLTVSVNGEGRINY